MTKLLNYIILVLFKYPSILNIYLYNLDVVATTRPMSNRSTSNKSHERDI